MNEKTVTIDGKEYPVRFNMSTLIAFEQTSDKSFFGENFDKLYSRVILVFAAMFAADEKITTEVLLNSNDWQRITRAFNTIMEMAAEFFKVPYPARSAVAVKTLPKNALVEIEVVAVKA